MTSNQQQAPTATMTMPTDREIQVERVFNAPRDRVFAAFTDPKLIPEWWGPGTVVDHMDVRTGGSWKFVGHNPGGESAFQGTYREVTPPERIVQTFETSWAPGRAHLETFTFEDLGDRTKLITTLLFDTTEERDGLFARGAEQGWNQTYARLDALLERLAAG